MIPACSLKNMLSDIDRTLGEKISYRYVAKKGKRAYRDMRTEEHLEPLIKIQEKTQQWSKLIGILFCPPTGNPVSQEIIQNLEYFHHRSDKFVDFFCAGYGAYWPEDLYKDKKEVCDIDGIKWFFSVRAYNSFRAEIEKESKWKYSGEIDLLLLTVRKRPESEAFLDFSTAIVCNLEKMGKDQAFTSARAFFEEIFRFAENFESPRPAYDLSDKMGIKTGKNVLKDTVLSILPKPLKMLYTKAESYAVRDISM